MPIIANEFPPDFEVGSDYIEIEDKSFRMASEPQGLIALDCNGYLLIEDAKRLHAALGKAIANSEAPRPATCKNCNDEGWVCENHRNVPWRGGEATCCADEGAEWKCGAGAPCPECNPCDKDHPPRMPPETKIIYDKDGSRH